MFLGIEIGGTKLQLGVGPGDGTLVGLWRGTVDPAAGGDGIRAQIVAAVPELLDTARVKHVRLAGVGVGFGGPVDDERQRIIKSHQIAGWDDFPLPAWLEGALGVPVVLGNDADLAGLAEALHGAGRGCSPVFYMTIGSGIGGGLVVDGEVYRACGRGAAEIGHLRILDWRNRFEPTLTPLEEIASGWAIGRRARHLLDGGEGADSLVRQLAADVATVDARLVGVAATRGDSFARTVLLEALVSLAEAICAAVVLLCPRRVVIGGGVSLIGEKAFFAPLREMIAERAFGPFAGLTDVVPAALGEAVVVHGALALAARRIGVPQA